MNMFTHNEIIAELKRRVADSSLRKVGTELGVSASYVHDILNNRRNISQRMATKLGYRLEVTKTVDKKYFTLSSQN